VLDISFAPAWQLSFVYLAPVTDSRDFDQQSCVVDCVHHAPVPHAYAPLAIAAFELPAPRRTGIGGKIFQVRDDALDPLTGQLLEFSLRA
jgi:hypothetical protein